MDAWCIPLQRMRSLTSQGAELADISATKRFGEGHAS
jgi:hypothetical protein